LDAGSIYAFTQDGYLLQLDPHTDQGTGKLLLVLPLGGEMTMHGFVSGGKAFVVLARGEVRAVDVKTQNVLWQQNLLSAPTAPLTVSTESRAVLVPLTSGDLACLDIESGKVRWRIDIKKEWNAPVGGIEAEGVVADGKYYVGTQKGFVLCWDIASGRRDWKFTTRGAKVSPARKISCRGLVHKGHFIQGSDDGFLYCVPID
jgi:outer membrane protein assembly factor BamB